MDLYRYFHPHHNPRLRNTPLRMQELGELEQAAIELSKAIKRAEVRSSSSPMATFRKEHFTEILLAAQYLVESLSTLTRAHPGDEQDTLWELLKEREEAPGWENWARLLKERLKMLSAFEDLPQEPLRKSRAGNES